MGEPPPDPNADALGEFVDDTLAESVGDALVDSDENPFDDTNAGVGLLVSVDETVSVMNGVGIEEWSLPNTPTTQRTITTAAMTTKQQQQIPAPNRLFFFLSDESVSASSRLSCIRDSDVELDNGSVSELELDEGSVSEPELDEVEVLSEPPELEELVVSSVWALLSPLESVAGRLRVGNPSMLHQLI